MTSQLNVVGRFRAGYVLNDRPATVTEWRITTGDPDVANTVHDILGGEAPQEWAAKGEDNLEVFTASKEVEIIIRDANALRQRLVSSGAGPQPDIDLFFRLAEAPALGTFWFRTASWSFATHLAHDETQRRLCQAAGASRASLLLRPVPYILRNGGRASRSQGAAVPALILRGRNDDSP